MVDTPDLDTAVFVRLLRDTVVQGRGVHKDDEMEGTDGSILILRWSDAKGLCERGDAELV